MNNKNTLFFPLYALSFLMLWVFSFTRLFGKGIEFDGALYAALGRNSILFPSDFFHVSLGQGNGYFYDHPPLNAHLLGFFYSLFGDHRAVEKIYTVGMSSLVLILVPLIYSALTSRIKISWAPMFFLALCSTFWVVAKNNWLECPLLVFNLSSFLFLILALKKNGVAFYLFSILSFLFLLGAFLIKGPIALYGYVTPFALYLFFKEKKDSWETYNTKTKNLSKLLKTYGIFFVGTFLCTWYFYADNSARDFWGKYFYYQVGSFIYPDRSPIFWGGLRSTQDSRFLVLWYIFQQIILPIGVFLGAFLVFHYHQGFKNFFKAQVNLKFISMLFIAISASFPFLLFHETHMGYLMGSYPFYALAFIFLFEERIETIHDAICSKHKKIVKIFCAFLFLLGCLQIPNYLKNGYKNQDYHRSFDPSSFPKIDSVKISQSDKIRVDGSVQTNLYRDFPQLKLEYSDEAKGFIIINKNDRNERYSKCFVFYEKKTDATYQILECSS